MSLTRTQPTTELNLIPDIEPTGSGAWREFTDADARRDAIAAELALDLTADPINTGL